jgi:membrane-associated protease RseP (regulator of RpoE activity)
VRSVIQGSPAEKAGIKAGDVITKVNDTRVSTPRDVTTQIRDLREKKTFPVTVVRNRQEMTLTVTLEDTASRAILEGPGLELPPLPPLPDTGFEFGLIGKPGQGSGSLLRGLPGLGLHL